MPGLLRGIARTAVVAGTATAVSNRVSRRQGERWSQQGYGGYGGYEEAPPPEPAPAPAAPPPAAAAADPIQQLKDLAELKEQGVLTPEEFAVQKSRILGS
jgi:hypothetical protein